MLVRVGVRLVGKHGGHLSLFFFLYLLFCYFVIVFCGTKRCSCFLRVHVLPTFFCLARSYSLFYSFSFSIALAGCFNPALSFFESISYFLCVTLSLPLPLSLTRCFSVFLLSPCIDLILSRSFSLSLCLSPSLSLTLPLSLSFSHPSSLSLSLTLPLSLSPRAKLLRHVRRNTLSTPASYAGHAHVSQVSNP